jgi:hypothetical protein
MKLSVLYLLCGFMIIGSFATAQVSIRDFLQGASSHPDLKTFDQQLNYLGKKPYRLSPLQKLEFRTQNRELITTQQEYALRISPANPWEIRSNNQYFKDYRTALQLEREIIHKELLTERYTIIIEYLYSSELRSLIEERQKLMATQLAILEQQLGSSYFDADEYVDLKIDHLTESVELEEIDVEILESVHQVERLYPEAFRKQLDWNYTTVITSDKIQQVADSISKASIRSSKIAFQQQRISLTQSEYKLEKSNIGLGFFQTSYDNRRVEQGRTPVNISLGFTIPITNPNKGDMAKRKLEQIEAEYDLEETKQEDQTDKIMIHDKLNRLIVQYNNLKTKIKELEEGSLVKTLTTLKKEDPLVPVQFSQNLIRLKVLGAKLQRGIRLAYIEYLGITDALQAQPMVNYLSNDLEILGNQ